MRNSPHHQMSRFVANRRARSGEDYEVVVQNFTLGASALRDRHYKKFKNEPTEFIVESWAAADIPKDVYACWIMFLSGSDGPCPVLQAPASISVAAAMDKKATFHVLAVRDATGEIVGIQPVQRGLLSIRFKTRKRAWLTVTVSGVSLIGTEPLAARTELKSGIFRSILHFLRDEKAIEFKELKRDDVFEEIVTGFVTSAYGLHRVGYQGLWRYANLPISIEAYNESLGKKKSYNLKRQDRILEEHFCGDLELMVVRNLHNLHLVIMAIYQLSNWPLAMLRWAVKDAEISCREGVACFFIVTCNGRLIGLVRATAHDDTLHVHSIHHNSALEKFSPGTISWQAVVRWAIEGQALRRIVFAYGVPARGNKPTSITENRSHVLIYRKHIWTSSVIRGHRLFNACKALVLKLIDRPKAAASATAE